MSHASNDSPTSSTTRHVLILGGGFGGVYTAIGLQELVRHDPTIRITLVSRNNYFVLTPLLFEAASGVLEPRHAVSPIRMLLSTARFAQGEVESVDIERREVRVRLAHDEIESMRFDHLVIALGGVTNTKVIPGSDKAMTFKTLADAIRLRNHVIQCFERADVESDAALRAAQLTFVIIGAGLVGVELMGELTDFVDNVADSYPRVDRRQVCFDLIEHGPKILRELDESLGAYGAEVLNRRSVKIRTATGVKSVGDGVVSLSDGTEIKAATVVLATGVASNPLLESLNLPKDKHGRLSTDPTMRVKGRDDIWALGDCASIPDPEGKPYPQLAQHAIREARILARNIFNALENRPLAPFVYKTLGTLAALGHYRGVGRVYKIRIKGFLAWWVWRSYYLFRMPRWRRRLHIMVDWTFALFMKNDIVRLDLDANPEKQ